MPTSVINKLSVHWFWTCKDSRRLMARFGFGQATSIIADLRPFNGPFRGPGCIKNLSISRLKAPKVESRLWYIIRDLLAVGSPDELAAS
jgi:hypothetical protein